MSRRVRAAPTVCAMLCYTRACHYILIINLWHRAGIFERAYRARSKVHEARERVCVPHLYLHELDFRVTSHYVTEVLTTHVILIRRNNLRKTYWQTIRVNISV
jgi:hypothetical protein